MELVLIFDLLVQIAPVVTSAAAVMVAATVYRYNRYKDKESIVSRSWNEQLAINQACIEYPELAMTAERLISGQLDKNDVEGIHRALYLVFIYLNKVYIMYSSFNSGIISRDELNVESDATLNLLKQDLKITKYALGRGYSDLFQGYCLERMEFLLIENKEMQAFGEFISGLPSDNNDN
ncbi:hypothetical protein [Roseibium polysiphoniae]|uniref:DUF4760 domain-containing protein n=1 Tax=Roseibium polysiphoniae TaxID=2571221 RepID=A0ABR9C948_9HYPH|nr:hypothetical protein [Roseibium polysiphoniae]MBD8875452.1 hypothetical protein [Roseibium polysiphoniae]